ncbi:protein phosphatase Slingshot isoform X3 [Nilaparvata lugens]|uniref:protein phosphatase Slingshot isoform X3 n=1 Tax=Nilaparvata lugens TaxID=108931 RepID=UPI00193E0185|nr:protein phosphatase Slingshot isoform X3 [Nilaparvata lugens]
MALVTVQRSPSLGNSPQSSVSPRRCIADICRYFEPLQQDSGTGGSLDEEDPARNNRSLSECYFAGKGAAVVLPPNQRAPPPSPLPHPLPPRLPPGAGGAGSGLGVQGDPQVEAATAPRLSPPGGSDIQQHLQSMFYLLRPEETLKMAVKLESVHPERTRYLVVVSCLGKQQRGERGAEESCLLGIDCNQETTVGLVLKVLADTNIKLDGDGGFKVNICNRQHIFKPVSVQAMWSALQTLYKVSCKAREENYFEGGLTHEWVAYYERRIKSEQSCLNEWHAMDNLESKRPPSPDSLRNKSTQRESTEENIRSKLKEIMMTVDLDEVTSKQVRTQLEAALAMDLGEYKPFIDQEMLVILGQMDAATEIFPHVYLGSEWNASNLDELNKNGVCHILNVTREIDNFFPGMFDYLNIRVYDDEKTDLLLHLENTFKYITKAQKEGSKVLVHCKMGVSRSASVVIAYAMKAYNWDLKKAIEYVQKKRNCIKPNKSFITQLETYQGILDAKKNKEKLQRETTADSRRSVSEGESESDSSGQTSSGVGRCRRLMASDAGSDLMGRMAGRRPKSWSPDHATANALFPRHTPHGATTLSLERLTNDDVDRHQPKGQRISCSASAVSCSTSAVVKSPPNQVPSLSLPPPAPPPTSITTLAAPPPPPPPTLVVASKVAANGGDISSSSSSLNSSSSSIAHAQNTALTRATEAHNYNIKVQMLSDNGPLYSVSQNKILQLSSNQSQESVMAASVKHRVNALESAATAGDMTSSTCSSSVTSLLPCTTPNLGRKERKAAPGLVLNLTSQFEEAPPPTTLVKKEEPWDPGEGGTEDSSRPAVVEVKTVRKLRGGVDCDPFSNRLDRVFDREERKQQRNVPSVVTEEDVVTVPVTDCEVSRQSSWSSYDSAVVLRDCISRQSSWGSADTRTCTLPSRNSSWGSYDLRPDSTTGTVKRTKQKLEEGSDTVKRVCPDTTDDRLTARVPSNETLDAKSNNKENNSGNITRSVSVDESKLSGSTNTNTNTEDGSSSPHLVENQKCISGIVKNLKKEFEAKSVGKKCDRSSPTEESSKEESRSLPSSPVSDKHPPRATADDLSVRKLVGKYEDRPRLSCSESEKRISQPPVPLRKSSLDVQSHPPKPPYINPIVHTFTNLAPVKSSNFPLKNSLLLTHNLKNSAGRPPTSNHPTPSVVAASVVAKAQSKKQQGKSHPLARLPINKRHNNPVYNTM